MLGNKKQSRSDQFILVITAGSSDIPVAEEAAKTAEIIGNRVERLYDCGVAGVHRLLHNKDIIFIIIFRQIIKPLIIHIIINM